jgi:hypothetical protein
LIVDDQQSAAFDYIFTHNPAQGVDRRRASIV